MWCCRGKRQSSILVEDVEVMVHKRASKKRRIESDSEFSDTSGETSQNDVQSPTQDNELVPGSD